MADAIGADITRLPITPPSVLALLDAQGGGDVKPAPFDYHAPATVDEAVALLAELGDGAKVLAGGQSLVPMLALRLAIFDHLVDLRRVEELRSIERRNGSLWIGAGTTRPPSRRPPRWPPPSPLLARATPFIGHFQIRNRGTIGGSIAHADPAAEYPAVALALDAELEAQSPAGRRTIPAADFFHGTWSTDLADDEVLVGVGFPVWEGRCGFAVEELARRHGDFALAGAVVAVQLDDGGSVTRCGIGLLGLGSTPERATAAETAVLGVAGGGHRRRRGRPHGGGDAGRGAVGPARLGRLPNPGRAPRSSNGPGPEPSRRPSMPETEIVVHVNGMARQARVEPRLTLADFIRERCHLTGTHLGLRARRVRRLHGAARRRGRALLPRVRGPGRRRRGHHDRGHERSRRRALAGAGGVPRRARSAVRVLHARVRGVGHRVPARQPEPHRRRRSARGSPATSAAAPATRASSAPSEPRPTRRTPELSRAGLDTDSMASSSAGTKIGGTADAAGVVDVGLVHRRVRQRGDQASLARGQHDRVSRGDDHGVRHVDLADPRGAVEAGQRDARLHHPAAVGERQLRREPRPHLAVDPGALGRRLGRGAQALEEHRTELEHGLDAPEAMGGGAQHQAGGALAVAVPHELRDRPAHRVADGDRLVDAEHVEGGDGVVGAVGQAHGPVGADAPTVATVVDGHHAVALGQRRVRGEPVGVGRHPDAVQEQHGRRAGGRGLVADEGRAPARQLERTARQQRRRPALRRSVRLAAGSLIWMLTSSTVRLAPVGEVKSTLSPGLRPTSASPSGDPGLMMSCSTPRSSTEPKK